MAGTVWMLPLAMDAALDEPRITLAKLLGVPLLIGAAIAPSCPRARFVVRGADQQLPGKILLVAGFASLLVLVWKLMWGMSTADRADHDDSPAGPD